MAAGQIIREAVRLPEELRQRHRHGNSPGRSHLCAGHLYTQAARAFSSFLNMPTGKGIDMVEAATPATVAGVHCADGGFVSATRPRLPGQRICLATGAEELVPHDAGRPRD